MALLPEDAKQLGRPTLAPVPTATSSRPFYGPGYDDPQSIDLGPLFGGQSGPDLSGGLSLGGLSLNAPAYMRMMDRQPLTTPQVEDPYIDIARQALSQNFSVGGMGPGAYGFTKGNTGLSQYRGDGPMGLQGAFYQALQKANQAMQAAGLGAFGITDGFRSLDAQYATKKKKGNLAATPGRSVHGLGLAADLKITDAQYKWLLKNGAQYGLVNLPSESWHWQLSPTLWKGGW